MLIPAENLLVLPLLRLPPLLLHPLPQLGHLLLSPVNGHLVGLAELLVADQARGRLDLLERLDAEHVAAPTEREELVLAVELEAGDGALEPDLVPGGVGARPGVQVDGDHVAQAPDVGQRPGQALVEQRLNERLLVVEVPEAVGDGGRGEGLPGERAAGEAREARLVGVRLVGLLGEVHGEVAVAGLGARGAAVAAAAPERAEAELDGGRRRERRHRGGGRQRAPVGGEVVAGGRGEREGAEEVGDGVVGGDGEVPRGQRQVVQAEHDGPGCGLGVSRHGALGLGFRRGCPDRGAEESWCWTDEDNGELGIGGEESPSQIEMGGRWCERPWKSWTRRNRESRAVNRSCCGA
jgi:hypothetical protein